ncbi:MAG: hypothetical protein ACFB03_00270 [Paracoccaceae bacterium]
MRFSISLALSAALGLVCLPGVALAQTADLRVMPPDMDFAQLCRRESGITADPAGLTAWTGDALSLPTDQVLQIADLYRHGSANASQDLELAKRLYLYVADTATGRDRARATYQVAKLIMAADPSPTEARQAASLFQEAASSGLGAAAAELASLYESGRGVEQDYERAARFYRIAAVQQQPNAAFALARLYADGLVAAPNPGAAQQMARLGLIEMLGQASTGRCGALLAIARVYDRGHSIQQDQEVASAWYLASAKAGEVRAMAEVADRYAGGVGVDLNMARAIEWYQSASEAGSFEATFEIGRLYSSGEGVTADPAQALTWLERAAESGSIKAMQRLGEFWAGDLPVLPTDGPDAKKSLGWFETAYQNDPKRLGVLSALAKAYSRGGDVPRDPELSTRFYREAMEEGSVSAMRFLADAHLAGDGVESNAAQALRLFRQAAGRGDTASYSAIERLYRCGIGTEQNISVAERWLDRAAAQGAPQAMLALAKRKLDAGGAEDAAERRLLLLRAAVSGSREAMIALAETYASGDEPDPKSVDRWRTLALTSGSDEERAEGLTAMAYAILGDGPLSGDPTEAFEMLEEAARLGNASAKLALGRVDAGGSKSLDAEERVRLTAEAAEAGVPSAWRAMARQALKSGDRAKALELLDRGIQAGDRLSRTDKAELLFDKGQGVDADQQVARALLDEAIATQPCSRSEGIALAEAFAVGVGGPDRIGEAFDWVNFVTTAFTLDADSSRRLGRAAFDAATSPEQIEIALSLVEDAAERGSAAAMFELSDVYSEGKLADEQAAALWLDRAAQAGHPEALYRRGMARITGIDVEQDTRGAIIDLAAAAEARNSNAMRELARLYLSGLAGEIDQSRAISLLEQAGEAGNRKAMIELANLHIVGIGESATPEAAVDWLTRAAETGSGEAMHRLSVFYATGFGVEADADRAQYWVDRAVDIGFLTQAAKVSQ